MMLHEPHEWEQFYREGDLPWDVRRPEPRILEPALSLAQPGALVVDLGCGAGDNAMAMAGRGYPSVGLDISETAIATARARAQEAGIERARFIRGNVLEPWPLEDRAGLVLDRGCYHLFDEAERRRLAQRLADALAPGGFWVVLCGNAEEPRAEPEQGPPRLTATQIVTPVEPSLTLRRLEQSHFTGPDGEPTHLAWRAIFTDRRPS